MNREQLQKTLRQDLCQLLIDPENDLNDLCLDDTDDMRRLLDVLTPYVLKLVTNAHTDGRIQSHIVKPGDTGYWD